MVGEFREGASQWLAGHQFLSFQRQTVCRQDELDLVGRRLRTGAKSRKGFADSPFRAGGHVDVVALKDTALDIRGIARTGAQPLHRHLSVSKRGEKRKRKFPRMERGAR